MTTRRICSRSTRTGGSPAAKRRSIRISRKSAVVERQRLRQRGVQVGGRRARRRHPRELRELVDECLERLDLADDGRRALLDQRARRCGSRAELPAHALGAELNRRQRVLDLVRQTPRDVAPRRHALRPDERRHVVEDEHRAAGAAVVRSKSASRPRRGAARGRRAGARLPAPPADRAAAAAPAVRSKVSSGFEILALADLLGPRRR